MGREAREEGFGHRSSQKAQTRKKGGRDGMNCEGGDERAGGFAKETRVGLLGLCHRRCACDFHEAGGREFFPTRTQRVGHGVAGGYFAIVEASRRAVAVDDAADADLEKTAEAGGAGGAGRWGVEFSL